jgi:hypothetical protein
MKRLDARVIPHRGDGSAARIGAPRTRARPRRFVRLESDEGIMDATLTPANLPDSFRRSFWALVLDLPGP